MTLAPVEPLASLTEKDLLELRSALTRGGFTEHSVSAAEQLAPGQFDAMRLPLVQSELARRGTAEATLTRLFMYSGAVSTEMLGQLLGPPLVGALREAGWLRPAEGAERLVSAFRLMPLQGLWLLHDDPAAGAEAVMGPGPTTLELLQWLPETLQGALLDVGCGAGTLALAGRQRGADRVIGTDLNTRAVTMARFNARLNQLGVEFREGHLLEPVRSERFDWVVAQPPYVTRPPDLSAITFLHGGARGDELAFELLAALPAVLSASAQALVLFDSAPPLHAAPLAERVRAVLPKAPLDLVLLSARGASATFQSMAYASITAPELGAAYATAVCRYHDHLQRLGIQQLSHTLVAARVREAASHVTVAVPVRSLSHPPARALSQRFAAVDLATSPEAVLLQQCIRASPGVKWVETRERPDASAEPQLRAVFPVGTVGSDQELSEASYVLAQALERSDSVAEGIGLYAEACEARPEEVRAQVLDFVRQGLFSGLLSLSRIR